MMVTSRTNSQSTTTSTRGNPLNDRILAAIDVGTNSIHMVVVQIQPSLPAFTIIARHKDMVRLGDRDPDTGRLTPSAMERGLLALRHCQDLAQSFNAEQIIAVATSAMREAPNGKDYLKQIESELGLQINLIAGPEEARRIYLGVLSGMELEGKPHIIIDIGGGSTELILGDGHESRFLSSTKVGAVRLTKEFVTTDPISEDELQYLQAYIKGMLERPVEELQSRLKPGEIPRMVGTSGTIECLAEIYAKEELGTVPSPLNGYTFSRKALTKIVENLASLDCKERENVPGVAEKRAEIIVPGAMILLEAMRMLDLEEITICESALREGMIVDWMLTHRLIENRLRYQSEVRDRSVIKIAHKYQVNLDYSQRVADFALNLFDQTQGILHGWGEDERKLLWAAAILHNCGLHISHSAYHKHSYYLIRNGELLGYMETEVELIANIARYHRKNKPKKKHDHYTYLEKSQRQLVREISALLRLAVTFDRRQVGAISQVKSYYNEAQKILHLILIPTEANDKCALELWSLNYEKESVEEEYDLKIVARLDSQQD